MTLYELLVDPFAANPFMRRALASCLALSLAAAPVGVLLMLRRLALFGDALAHGILPGVALGFALAGGFSVVAMSLGGLVAGLIIALAAGFFARRTVLREDAALAGSYLTALALGIAIVSMGGGRGHELMHLLFGSVLAVDDAALLFIAGSASITLAALALLWRGVVLETLDPGFLRAAGARPGLWQAAFLGLVVLNLVAACQAVGTLMAVGVMMLPALAARFWSAALPGIVRAAVLVGLSTSVAGLLASYHLDLPSGPAIVLAAALAWGGSMLAGPEGSLAVRLLRRPHLAG